MYAAAHALLNVLPLYLIMWDRHLCPGAARFDKSKAKGMRTKGFAGVPSVLRKHVVVGAKQVKPQLRPSYDSRAGVITKTKAQSSDEEIPATSPESDQ